MTRRPPSSDARDRGTRSVEECLRAIEGQLVLLSDVLRAQAHVEPDDGLRPEALHALSSMCEGAQAELTSLRRRLPIGTLNFPGRSAQ